MSSQYPCCTQKEDSHENTKKLNPLVVDCYEPNGKTMIWRGVAEASVTPNNSEKNTKRITKALDEMFEKLGKVLDEAPKK